MKMLFQYSYNNNLTILAQGTIYGHSYQIQGLTAANMKMRAFWDIAP
jgi:hypothetical protein